jgi:AcrR family transcriptional regulator
MAAVPYEEVGRTAQKQRTRDALLEAARELVGAGGSPTVEEAALAAGISRTTAYRYFPNQRALLAAAHPEIATRSLLPADASDDPEARLDTVLEAFTRIVVDNEQQQRTMLRLSLEPVDGDAPPLLLRQGRAIAWIEEALDPLRTQMSAPEIHRLAVAIRSTCGIETLVWLTDIAGLSRADAVEVQRWSARALLRAALADRQ